MHNRKFVPGRVDMVKIRFLNTKKTADIQDEIEQLIIKADFLKNTPFTWIGLIYRYGLINKLKPQYQRIDKKDGELPIAIELDSHILKWADNNCPELFREIFIIGGLDALIDVGRKYKLPMDLILQEKEKKGDIPNTIEECERWVSAHG